MRFKFMSTISGTIRQLFLALLMGAAAHAETTFYVATNGSDAASGTINAPLATLDVARDKLRALTMDYAVVDGATEITIAAWVHPDSKGANNVRGIETSYCSPIIDSTNIMYSLVYPGFVATHAFLE